MIIKILRILVLIPLLIGCGFKVINENQLRNFDIVNVISTGDNRINFLLKKNLKSNKDRYSNKIELNLETNKLKEIKEKNIKNEITKYSISIKTKINYNIVGSQKEGSFIISKKGNYNIASQYSQTITNENNLVNSLTGQIEEDIINRLINIINDL